MGRSPFLSRLTAAPHWRLRTSEPSLGQHTAVTTPDRLTTTPSHAARPPLHRRRPSVSPPPRRPTTAPPQHQPTAASPPRDCHATATATSSLTRRLITTPALRPTPDTPGWVTSRVTLRTAGA